MTSIRPETLLRGALGKASYMHTYGAKKMYLRSPGRMWWVYKKSVILANAPVTIEEPTRGQLETRIRFGEIAHSTAGKKLEERLDIIRNEMTGYRAPHRLSKNKWKSKQKRTLHTLAELKAMEARYGGRKTTVSSV